MAFFMTSGKTFWFEKSLQIPVEASCDSRFVLMALLFDPNVLYMTTAFMKNNII